MDFKVENCFYLTKMRKMGLKIALLVIEMLSNNNINLIETYAIHI